MATIKPPHGKQSKVVWLDDLIILNLKRQAIESPEGNVKNYMESLITCFAMSKELQELYTTIKQNS